MIREAIKALAADDRTGWVLAEVTEVNEQEGTCTCSPLDGAPDLFDVRIQAGIEREEGMRLIPRVGSHVAVQWQGEYYLIVAWTEVDKVLLRVGDMMIEVTENGIVVGDDSRSLMQQMSALIGALQDLIEVLKVFQLSTNMGPTISVMPHITAQLDQLKQQLSNVESEMDKFLD